MSGFTILQNVSKGAMRYAHTTVNTNVLDDVAHAAVTRRTGMTNPLHILTVGQLREGVFRPDVYARVADSVVRGTGGSAFDDAVKALHNLGRRHGVDGISLSENPNLYGTIKRTGSGVYVSGKPIVDSVGRDAAFRIDAAARRVMDFVEAGAR